MKLTVVAITLCLVLALCQDVFANEEASRRSGLDGMVVKRQPVAVKHGKATGVKLHKAPRPTVNAEPRQDVVTSDTVTGWAERLSDDEDSGLDKRAKRRQTKKKKKTPPPKTYRATRDAVGTAPRFVAWGNYMVANNSIGTPDPSTSIKGLTHYNLAFWVSKGGNAANAGGVYTGSGNAQEWAAGDKSIQRQIVKEYNKNGIRLGVSLFGAVDTPQSDGHDPVVLAQTIASFVKSNNLQGVDVDYEEFDLLTDWSGKGANWLIPFIRTLRRNLPRPTYYISAAPVAPLFNGQQFPNGFASVVQQVGGLIDFYNVQFYNQGGAFSDCNTLLYQSDANYPNSSVSQLINMWNVPPSKLVIGKPARPEDAITYTSPVTGQQVPDGYMTPQLERTCLQQARKIRKWQAGTAWWQYKGYLQDVIRPARSAVNA